MLKINFFWRQNSFNKVLTFHLVFFLLLVFLFFPFHGVDAITLSPEFSKKNKIDVKYFNSLSEVKQQEIVDEIETFSSVTSVSENKWLNSYATGAFLPNISNVSGAFTHDISLNTPSGRNGLEPSLKLSYASNNRNPEGIFGIGWTINIPYIELMNKSGTEDLYDTDAQFFVSSIDGELEGVTGGGYMPRATQSSYHQYKHHSSINYSWTMTNKVGNLYTFGSTTSARIKNPSDSTEIYNWMLEEVRDTDGNYIKYEYTKNNDQVYPYRITYTGHGTTDGDFEVTFTTESRTDEALSYKRGFKVKTLLRVSKMDVTFDGDLVRRFEFDYTTGDNGARSLLSSITETGYDETGSPTSFPATAFTYQTRNTTWTQNTPSPFDLPDLTDSDGKDTGFRVFNYERGGKTQFLSLKEGSSPTGYEPVDWDSVSVPSGTPALVDSSGNDVGSALADVNGDLFPDILTGQLGSPTYVYLWDDGDFASTSLSSEPIFIDSTGNDRGTRMGDFNGDGYADHILRKQGLSDILYLNDADGTGWSDAGDSNLPWYFTSSSGYDYGARVVGDLNGDGLDDVIKRDDDDSSAVIEINKGDGTSWDQYYIATSSQYAPPKITGFDGKDIGTRVADINADGLPDLIVSTPSRGIRFYLNQGDGLSWLDASTSSIPYFLDSNEKDIGTRIMQGNIDGIPDFVTSSALASEANYISSGNPVDVITSITLSEGGSVDVTYKGTAVDSVTFQTVDTVTRDPNITGSETMTDIYTFSAGEFKNDYKDRKFRGFGVVDKRDSANASTTVYYHQGNGNNTGSPNDPFDSYALGECEDVDTKMYQPYRTEKKSVGSSNFYSLTINCLDTKRTESVGAFDGVDLVFTKDTTSLFYDNDTDHKDSAVTFNYATSTGNLLTRTEWGEVNASTDGTFSDTSTDKRTTTIAYATGSQVDVTGLPSTETMVDYADTKMQETRHYYDSLSLGSVDEGNETKTEFWKTGSTYIDTEKTYNSYGLVATEKDPRNKTTTYTYDSFNLYVATSTNPKSHITQFYYDYSLGALKQTINPNGFVFETIYDGLDRPITEKQPDISTPSTLVTSKTYAYTDTVGSRKILETTFLNGSTSTLAYTYLDGLNRTIQTRTEAEGANYSVRDFVYNTVGFIQKESLLYFSSGTARTTATTNNNLYTTFAYDALGRVVSQANSVGTTTYSFDQWEEVVTDAKNNSKDLHLDAFGNLVKVEEHNGVNTYTTNYVYNARNDLAKITDDASNIHNFTYDGLSRLTKSEDIHDAIDTTFGSTTLTYDDSGNITYKLDPKNQTVNFTYDDINRPLTEDYTDVAGTEVMYKYDSCDGGIGFLCSATTTDAVTNLVYNAHGLVEQEEKTIDSTSYVTSYSYNRQGNNINITYPDNSEVEYAYNTAGLLESIAQKEDGGSFLNIVDNFDYSPTGQVTLKKFSNGIQSIYTYDANALYRLTNILTTASTTGGEGEQALLGNFGSNLARVVEKLPLAIKSSLDIFSRLLPDEDIVPYTESSDTFELIRKDASDTGKISIEITKNHPEIHLKKWGGEVDLGVLYDNVHAIGTLTSDGNQTKWKDVGEEVHAYPLAAQEGMEDGGFEIKIYLKDHPDTNMFTFTLRNYEDLDFFYQPELTKQEIEEGVIRPENVLGSYAVYHKTKRGHTNGGINYGIGKVFHIYRPHITDAANNEVWGELSYKDGALTVTVSQEFLDSATYPVVVDPTFGYTSIGASTATAGADDPFAIKFFLTEDGDVSKLIQYAVDDTGTPVKGLVYSDSSNYPGALQGGAGDIVNVPTTVGWYDLTYTTPFSLTTGTYWIGWASDTNFTYYYDSGTTNQRYFAPSSDGYANPPDPYPSGATGSNRKVSIYATYTVSATNTAPIASTLLLTEDTTNPISITDTTPEFSAIYNDSDSGDIATNYQIQVTATSSDWTNLVWDSTKISMASTVEGTRSPDVSYGGTPLSLDGTTYYLRIKFWDDDDAEGAWSTGNDYFSMYSSEPQTAKFYIGSADGSIYSYESTDWDTVHDDPVGNWVSDYGDVFYVRSGIHSGGNVKIERGYLPFDTSNLPDNAEILEAKLHVYVSTKKNDDNDGDDWITVVEALPATLPTIIKEDFDEMGDAIDNPTEGISTSSRKDITDITTQQYHTFTLNSTGESWIDKTGWTTLSIREGHDVIDSSFSGTSNQYNEVKIYAQERTGTTTDSYLEITYQTTPSPLSVGVIQDISFTYDSVGNITNITDISDTGAGKSTTYIYDNLYRLSSASTTVASSTPYSRSYTYNPIGNIITKSDQGTYTYAETGYANPHAVTSLNGVTYTYDNNGNVTDIGTDTYTRNYRDRLITSTVGGNTSLYTYDYNNIRVTKGDGNATTTYPNMYYNKKRETTTKHIFLPDGTLVATIEGNGVATSTSYIHTDHLGGTNVTTNENGDVTEVTDYYPFGEQRVATTYGGTPEQRKFTGHEYDEKSNLTYAKQRYYPQDVGRWLSQDPFSRDNPKQFLVDPQQMNFYSYVRNNPIILVDENGEYVEVSGSLVVPGRSFSLGLRFDKSGIDGFMGGGFGAGLSGGVNIAWAPGVSLSHQREAAITANGTAAYYGGVRISQDLLTYYPNTKTSSKFGRLEPALTIGFGLSGSVEEQLSRSLYIWGNNNSTSLYTQTNQSLSGQTSAVTNVASSFGFSSLNSAQLNAIQSVREAFSNN